MTLMTIFLHRNLRSFNDKCSRISRSRISPCHKMVFRRAVSAPPGEQPPRRCRCQNQEKWGQKSRHEKMMSKQQQQQKGMFVALYIQGLLLSFFFYSMPKLLQRGLLRLPLQLRCYVLDCSHALGLPSFVFIVITDLLAHLDVGPISATESFSAAALHSRSSADKIANQVSSPFSVREKPQKS